MRSFLIAILLLLSSAAWAEPLEVAVLLAVDVSASVSHERFILQKGGIVAALRSERIRSSLDGRMTWIGVSEWSGTGEQRMIISKEVHTPSDLEEIAVAYENHVRSFSNMTALGDAIMFAVTNLEEIDAEKKVIDVSGDGRSNAGQFTVEQAIEKAEEANITVNGLPIEGHEPGITKYYEEFVRTRNGFTVPAASFADIARAMEQKLFQEISLLGPQKSYQ